MLRPTWRRRRRASRRPSSSFPAATIPFSAPGEPASTLPPAPNSSRAAPICPRTLPPPPAPAAAICSSCARRTRPSFPLPRRSTARFSTSSTSHTGDAMLLTRYLLLALAALAPALAQPPPQQRDLKLEKIEDATLPAKLSCHRS